MNDFLSLKKKETIFIVLLLAVAIMLRIYNISGYMTFLGDEGRDALIVRDLLVNRNIPFIGPPMSFGNVYLGPLYYYMMAVAMSFSWLNPVAAALMVAVLSVGSILLLYFLSRDWFGKQAAGVAALLYSLSPVLIVHARSSWNPNPAPFFSLLVLLGVHLSYKYRDFRWLILSGASLSAALQMHYLALILIPSLGVLWLIGLFKKYYEKISLRFFWIGSLGAVSAFVLILLPFGLFEKKHGFPNSRAFWDIFFSSNSQVSVDLIRSLSYIWHILSNLLVTRFMTGNMPWLGWSIAGLLLLPLCLFWCLPKQSKMAYLTLYLWLILGLVSLSFYKKNIYDHYLFFVAPAIYILFGSLLSLTNRLKNIHLANASRLILIGLIIGLVVVNLRINPLRYTPGNQLKRTQEVARFIIEKSQGRPFNFALLSKWNYDAAYQFYLTLYNHDPKQVPFEITDQLFVVCEDPICQPVGNPKYEIAAFGWTKIAEEYTLTGVKIYKLIHIN